MGWSKLNLPEGRDHVLQSLAFLISEKGQEEAQGQQKIVKPEEKWEKDLVTPVTER